MSIVTNQSPILAPPRLPAAKPATPSARKTYSPDEELKRTLDVVGFTGAVVGGATAGSGLGAFSRLVGINPLVGTAAGAIIGAVAGVALGSTKEVQSWLQGYRHESTAAKIGAPIGAIALGVVGFLGASAGLSALVSPVVLLPNIAAPVVLLAWVFAPMFTAMLGWVGGAVLAEKLAGVPNKV